MTSAPIPPKVSADILAAFVAITGPSGMTTDPDTMAPWLSDWRGRYHGRAAAMVLPSTTQQVADIVHLCRLHRIAIVPQGGNSGMVGGATPDASGNQILLSTRRLASIRSIDRSSRLCVAEAGVVLENLHEMVAAAGLRFPLTLGGKGSATIGGLVSTNAGGTQVLRHGTMRALVDGIEAVLPNGEIFDGLAALKKDNRGYDLRHLLCGAEGSIGIVTAATLRLVPAIADRCVGWIGLASPDAALAVLRRLDDALGVRLEGFELLPQRCLDAVLRHIPQTRAPLNQSHPWHILVEMVDDSVDHLADCFTGAAAGLLADGLIDDLVIAKNEAEADRWWRIRDSISEAERASGPAIQHDVSVPVDRMPEFIAHNPARLDGRFNGVAALSFGHLGDGNIHHHVLPPPGTDGALWIADHGDAVSAIVYDHVTELGGSLSAEHGIGQMKRDALARLSSPARLAMLRGIKAGLDPLGLFNPGKLVP